MIDVIQCDLVYNSGPNRVPVYQDFSLHIARGESLVLIGPSGCGKSTLLFLLAGLLRPSQGKILIDNEPVAGPRRRTAFILQEYGLFPWLSVADNVSLGLRVRHQKRRDYQEKVAMVLEQMGLSEVKERYPAQLSGGQRQRVALARALSLDPDLLLMDEPLSSLDALTRERLQELLLDIWHRGGLTTVLVTHSIEEAVCLGSRILVLGGPPVRILAEVVNPEARANNFRQSPRFYELCAHVRSLLAGGSAV